MCFRRPAVGHARASFCRSPSWTPCLFPGDAPPADPSRKLHVFDFEHYNIVGYNSVPNQLPLFCNLNPEDISAIQAGRCVWEAFKKQGAVTMMADEVHDNCQSPTSVLHALTTEAFWLDPKDMPDHQVRESSVSPPSCAPTVFPSVLSTCARSISYFIVCGMCPFATRALPSSLLVGGSRTLSHSWQMWRLYCSPHVPPCCWASRGFLNPGRRQCVGGGRELHDVVISYLEQVCQVWGGWASTPIPHKRTVQGSFRRGPPLCDVYASHMPELRCAFWHRELADVLVGHVLQCTATLRLRQHDGGARALHVSAQCT
eukprot:scaffold297680_cov32-Tisochrysis_lutea.AAC.3